MNIVTITNEAERGCGFRREGGMYMISMGVMEPCFKLPIPLEICPCCGGGIKPSLGFTWINPSLLIKAGSCGKACRGEGCGLFNPPEKAGLLWIGESFYKTPEAWLEEAKAQGVSRKIGAVPRNFIVGKTMVFVAHRKVIDGKAGIFHAFVPQRIEYILKGNETGEQLQDLEKRGFTLVKLVRTDGEHNKMRFHREIVAGEKLYHSDNGRYVIKSLAGGTTFQVSQSGGVPEAKTETVKSYEKAKEVAEQWEKEFRKIEK